MVFAAAKKIGWVDDESHRLDHIGFGTVQGEDGKRFKTRSGDTVRLVDLLDEAVLRMEASLKERISEGRANISEVEVHETASAMGYGAVKYFDLRRNPTSNYVSFGAGYGGALLVFSDVFQLTFVLSISRYFPMIAC